MELKGKKILVVGLGKSGLAAALFLRRRGAQVTVSDVRSAEALAKEIPALLEEGIAVEAGGHGLLTFRRQDLIVVSPGVPLNTPEIVQVKSFGLPVIGEVELAARYLKGKVLAITGSNGKTTTTSLCGEILEAGGLPVAVGGNIGLPVIALVEDSRDDGWSVLEVSSFQLETTEKFRPEIAVILNVTPDHLDRHVTFENYVAAKERIFAKQTAEDALVLNWDDPVTRAAAERAPSRVFWFSRKEPVERGAYLIDGEVVFRVRERLRCRRALSRSRRSRSRASTMWRMCWRRSARRGWRESKRRRFAGRCEGFHAVEHRLEFVATLNGVDYYNDSKATNVDAAAKAISSFSGGIHLILGGKDKNSDYTQLSALLKERVKAVYTIGAAAEKIESHIRGDVPIVSAGTLVAAVNEAGDAAMPGEIVLLAPACSSFDQFENYEHRGRVFKELVMARKRLPEWQSA